MIWIKEEIMKEIIKSIGLGFLVSLPFIIFLGIIITGIHFFGDSFILGSMFFIVTGGLPIILVYKIKKLGKEFVINTLYNIGFITIILSIVILPTYFFNTPGLIFTGVLLSLFFFYGIGQEFIMNKLLKSD